MLELLLNTGSVSSSSPTGEYTLKQTSGTQTVSWVVPDDVTSICAVVVGNGAHGGGGLSYRNDIPVTPGETLSLQFTTNSAGGTSGVGCRIVRGATALCVAFSGGRSTVSDGNRLGGSGGKDASGINDGGGNGGIGTYTAAMQVGGGAGGYAGAGGNASSSSTGTTAGDANSGSGSGGRAYAPATGSRTGGYVGLHGIGATAESVPINVWQGGKNGSISKLICGGGFFTTDNAFNGGIRIIWGAGRSFPNNAA